MKVLIITIENIVIKMENLLIRLHTMQEYIEMCSQCGSQVGMTNQQIRGTLQ